MKDGFNAVTQGDEVSAGPNARIYALDSSQDVTEHVRAVIAAAPDALARTVALENIEKQLVAGCEQEAGYRCRLYSVSVDALIDRDVDDEAVATTVVDEGDKGSGADGLETDDQGRIYITAYEHDAILRRRTDGQYETLAHDPRLLWPDTMSVAADGHLYVTANQLHRQARYQGGQDKRRKPYGLFRVAIDAGPVMLRP